MSVGYGFEHVYSKPYPFERVLMAQFSHAELALRVAESAGTCGGGLLGGASDVPLCDGSGQPALRKI